MDIEKKVALDEENLKKIERKGTFQGSRIHTDTYFDTPNFRYTTSDIWLRERRCQFELIIGVGGLTGDIDHYEEVTEENKILEKMGLEKDKDLARALIKAKIFPFASFQTIRRMYQIDDLSIDLDLAYYGDFIHRSAFIRSPKEQEVDDFIEEIGIDTEKDVQPKLVEFLLQKNPNHYQALKTSGIV